MAQRCVCSAECVFQQRTVCRVNTTHLLQLDAIALPGANFGALRASTPTENREIMGLLGLAVGVVGPCATRRTIYFLTSKHGAAPWSRTRALWSELWVRRRVLAGGVIGNKHTRVCKQRFGVEEQSLLVGWFVERVGEGDGQNGELVQLLVPLTKRARVFAIDL